ncbi:MAG: MobQ family relaxase [Smithella sp.]
MAIYHLSVQIISRTGARSAIAAAAYRSRSAMYDERQGLTFDYAKKKDLVHSEIMLPVGAPERLLNRETLWNEVEAMEKRRDAQLAREIDVALPRELSLEQQINLIREFCSEEFTKEGMIADINIHNYKDNPHAHIMLTMREVTGEGFGKKNRLWNKKEEINAWRRKWAEKINTKLLEAGFGTKIDHRSFEERGVELIPQRHVGYNIKFVPKEYLQLDNTDLDKNT